MDFSDFSQILYAYLYCHGNALGFTKEESDESTVFSKGELYDYSGLERKADAISELTPGYPSYPLNPPQEDGNSDVRERGRLKFSADSIDFFRDGSRNEARLNGTVLIRSSPKWSSRRIFRLPSGTPSRRARSMPARRKSI